MDTELLLKELESAYERQYKDLGSKFKPYRLTDELKVEAMIANKFSIDWQRFDYDSPCWHRCVVFDAEAQSQENAQQKALTVEYLKLRACVLIHPDNSTSELKAFISKA